jgi:hypothetical protein
MGYGLWWVAVTLPPPYLCQTFKGVTVAFVGLTNSKVQRAKGQKNICISDFY